MHLRSTNVLDKIRKISIYLVKRYDSKMMCKSKTEPKTSKCGISTFYFPNPKKNFKIEFFDKSKLLIVNLVLD
jgi:hypothetical protein